MARFILETAGEDITVGGTDVEVIGTNAGGEVITVVGGNITLDASFAAGGDTIELAGEAETYTATLSGSRVVLTSSTGATISIPVGEGSLAVDFGGDDVRELRVEGGAVMFGAQTVAAGSDTTLDPGSDDGNIVDALEALQAAETALSDFETANDTAANLRADLATEEGALATARAANSDAELAADLVAAEADVEAAQTDVAAVAGLEEAISDLAAAEAAATAASDALDEAEAEEAGAVAAYNARVGNDDVAPAGDTLELAADGTWSGEVVDTGGDTLIELDADGEPMLASGVTETTNPGVTALMAAIVATERAEVAEDAALEVQADAQAQVDVLDQSSNADGERQDIADFDDAVADYEAALEAYNDDTTSGARAAALEAAYAVLVDPAIGGVAAVATDTDADFDVDAVDIAAQETVIQGAIDAREDDLDLALELAEGDNPLVTQLDNALAGQTAAEAAIEARNDLITAEAGAQALVDEVGRLEGNIEDARDAVEDLGYATPVTVGGAAEVGTSDNDVYIFADADGTIDGFGAEGEDILFIGSGYTVVNLTNEDIDVDAVGEIGTLEIFMQQDGADTVLYIEDESFAGNVADGSFSGSTIVLTDVDMDDVSFDSTGYITIEEAAIA